MDVLYKWKSISTITESDTKALSNVGVSVENSSKGIAPFTPPEARHSKNGESVRYIFDHAKRWFVLRIPYGRYVQVADLLIEAKYYVYIAQRYEYCIVNGYRRKVLKELIPNILFVYIEKKEIEALLSRKFDNPSPNPKLARLATFYYNHFETEGGKNLPLEVPNNQMQKFIEFTRNKNENIVFVNNDNIVHVKKDSLVRVTDGVFKGCVGNVIRLSGQQRVGIRLINLGWVVTSYVPSAFLEVITQDDYNNYLHDINKKE